MVIGDSKKGNYSIGSDGGREGGEGGLILFTDDDKQFLMFPLIVIICI